MNNRHGLLPFGLAVLLFFSCGTASEQAPDQQQLLLGRWMLDQAEMNGTDRSDRMRGTFFHFLNAEMVTSNFNPEGVAGEYPYAWEETGEILVEGGYNPLFRHRFLGTDSLILETFLNQNRLRFFLVRDSQPPMQTASDPKNPL
jgi:hypothetical protein